MKSQFRRIPERIQFLPLILPLVIREAGGLSVQYSSTNVIRGLSKWAKSNIQRLLEAEGSQPEGGEM